MSNYIQIKVGVPTSGDLPLKVAAIDPTLPQVTVGTGFDGAGTSAAVAVTGGGTNASGGQATITTAATTFDVTGINITAGGQNYEVGQVITITIPNGVTINNSGAAIDTTVELTADMLIAAPDDGVELIDADQVVCVKTPASSANVVELFTNEYNGTAVSKYTCTFELDNTTIEELAVNISEAFRKAEQAENSQPFVELGDADCLSVSFA